MSDAQLHQPIGLTARVNEHATAIKWCSIGLIVIALLWTMRSLPVERAVQVVNAWVESLGVWGPLAFGLVYILATVLLLPASALTLAAGAVFGLGTGTVTVSVASTIGAGLAFLIARYFAREKMAAFARRNPKFNAVDRAIGEGGWKIVALLRLSPAVPFNVQNYLYGVTSIRFWTCFLTSWIAMLPGTFMYVYLGHVGGQGLAAASGAAPSRSTGEWVMLAVGLLATAAVTVYVSRVARAAMERSAPMTEAPDHDLEGGSNVDINSQPPQGWPWGASLAATLALLAVGGAACAHFQPQLLQGVFGSPSVTLSEAYADPSVGSPAQATFDHSTFDSLLRRTVDEHGWVDYAAIASNPKPLDGYIAALGTAPFDELGRNEKLALLINAYNAFTLRLIVDHWDGGRLKSIKDIPKRKRWADRRWNIGGQTFSLDDIEHKQIRPKFAEPRIHFALVCAAVGCPKLRSEAYQADRLDGQLADQTRYVHRHDRWFRYDPASGSVHLTKLYDWYGGDFKQVAGSVLDFAARYSDDLKVTLQAGRKPKIKWLRYDWKLNDKANAQ
ncbi:MAG: VTT domain-containing protein [Planctomycetes bacterium]|nr:VTT domain-containing protein [Planctomycetota bacterium]